MGLHKRLLPVVTITGSSLMVGGCGGGSGGSCGSAGSACPPPIVLGPGYYEGTLTAQSSSQSTPAVAIVAETGNGAMSGQDGTYYRFNVGFSGTTLSGNYYGLSAGGTQKTTGTISAQATSSALTGTFAVGSSTVDSFQMNLEAVYNQTSALATLMGTWSYTDTANGFSLTVTIASNGSFTGTDSSNCAYAGSFGIINPVFDAYSETYTRSCNGTTVTFTGFATYLPASGGANAQIEVLADDNVSEFLAADLE
jgi:hypothetical protein